MDSLPVYDVVLLPPPSVNKKAVAISRQLQSENMEFCLGFTGTYPHLSLYMANFTPDNAQQVQRLLADIAATTPALPLQASHYGHNEHGMFELFYEKTANITDLQQRIIETCNPLRSGVRRQDPVGRQLTDRLAQTTGEEHDNIDTYGYDEIGSFFKPHITFARSKQRGLQIDTSSLPAASDLGGTFAILALCEMGEHGTCTRAVASFDLQGYERN